MIPKTVGLSNLMPKHKVEFARQMRKNPTEAEKCMWCYLRAKRTGFKFKRQVRMVGYIVDFYCPQYSFVVEVDGSSHDPKADKIRDKHLLLRGIRTFRISNEDAIFNTGESVQELLDVMQDGPMFI